MQHHSRTNGTTPTDHYLFVGEVACFDVPNWLVHTQDAAKTDAQLFFGTSTHQMKSIRRSVRAHLQHLRVEHSVTVEEINGVHRMLVSPENAKE